MEGVPLKKFKTIDFDTGRCIICQKNTKEKTTSTENGCKKIIDCAKLRKDKVYDRVILTKGTFVYHMTNTCYKIYVHLEKASCSSSPSSVDNSNENEQNLIRYPKLTNRSTRSQSTPRPPCSSTSDIYKTSCVICGCAYKNTYEKYRISEDNRANNVLKATIYSRDKVYVRTRDLQDVYSVFGADLYCHKNCIRRYLHKYDRALKKDNDSGTSPTLSEKECVFNVVLLSIDADLRNGVGYPLSEMKDACNNLIDTTKHNTFTNKELKILLFSHFQDEISFTVPPNPTKSAMVYVSSIDKNDIAETVRNFNPIKETALKMREILLKENDPLEDKCCDANDLSDAWYNIKIPEVIL